MIAILGGTENIGGVSLLALVFEPVMRAFIQGLIIDPMLWAAGALLCFSLTIMIQSVQSVRRETAIRRRLEQRLAPAVTQQIVAHPHRIRLSCNIREVTALFTDIADFTAMTDRADLRDLVVSLDDYFDGVSRVVMSHGGMIDKIVGDGLHALFNAPFDVEDHPRRALECAEEILEFAKAFCESPLARKLHFGCTRIGLETGVVIVGDVGGDRKLDYTAHGNAVNAAARFQSANKELGTRLCIGPGAAARIGRGALRPLGQITIKGRRDAQEVFSVWPENYTASQKTDYERAVVLSKVDAEAALSIARSLARTRKDDLVLEKLRARLAAQRDDTVELRQAKAMPVGKQVERRVENAPVSPTR